MIADILSKIFFSALISGFILFLFDYIGMQFESLILFGPIEGFIEDLINNASISIYFWQNTIAKILAAMGLSILVTCVYGWLHLKLKLKYLLAMPLAFFFGFFFEYHQTNWQNSIQDPKNHLHEMFLFMGLFIVAAIAVRTIDQALLIQGNFKDINAAQSHLKVFRSLLFRLLVGGSIAGVLYLILVLIAPDMIIDMSKFLRSSYFSWSRFQMLTFFPIALTYTVGSSIFTLVIYAWGRYNFQFGISFAFIIVIIQWLLIHAWLIVRWGWNITTLETQMALLANILIALVAIWSFSDISPSKLQRQLSKENPV